MQGLQSLFARIHSAQPVVVPVQSLKVLDACELKLVSGGLPRIGGLGGPAVVAPPVLPAV